MYLRQIKTADEPTVKKIIQATLAEFNDAKPNTAYYDPQLASLATYYNSQPTKAFYWVVEDQQKVIGCGGFGPFADPQIAELQKLYFLPAARGFGLGKKIILASEQKARQLGYQQLYIETFSNLERAIGLYRHLGFRALPQALAQTSHSACDAWFIKDLN
ncbi:GNAT family N-acetyltransferase [Liquorilactobacillus sicerae]|uniref:GNAT family N-acetyltransferase n=1 Tax=Liquorilactobacillus sicerae TaxID=1416943 RepID=UPI0024813D69|nr:GNAT family N-acetyltransferase [Liquorilactobacillus sicerae]